MAFGAAPPPTSLPGIVSACEEQALITFAGRYLGVWGLVDATRAKRAARRLVVVVLASGEAQSPRERRRRILLLTRRWVEEFARGTNSSSDGWFWRAQSLLARYPRAFLETPIPFGGIAGDLSLLPEPEPRPMMQQTITDSFERLSAAVREVMERVKGARSIAEPERVVQPSS